MGTGGPSLCCAVSNDKVDFPPGFGECFPTLLASAGHPVPGCVQFLLVLYQRALGAKPVVALVTLEWLLSRVDPLVYLQQRDMRKFLWALWAGVGMGRGLDMTPLVSGECLLAAALLATLLTRKKLCVL